MERIIVATDGSTSARAAVSAGVDLARMLGAAVTFVSVRHRIPMLGDPYYQRKLTEQLASAHSTLEEAMDVAERLGVEGDYEVAEGDPVEAILRTARYREAEMIVVGSRGRGAIAGTLLGSVSRGLVELSPVPVLVVKEATHGARGVKIARERELTQA